MIEIVLFVFFMYVKLREIDSIGLVFIVYNSNLFSNIVKLLFF